MKTKKTKKTKPKKLKKKKVDPNIEDIYYDTITFYCPIREKNITQKVQVKKYKSLGDILRPNKAPVTTTDPLDGIEDDEEVIYGDTTESDE